MNILGVAFLSDASACVLSNGEVLSAVSEERLNRIKLWHGVPHNSIEKALKLANMTIDDIDVIATHGKCPETPDIKPFKDKEDRIKNSGLSDSVKQIQIDTIRSRYEHESRVLGERTPGFIKQLETYGKTILLYPHHLSHAATAYYGSGYDSCYVLTADGWGEDASSTFWKGENGELLQISKSYTFDSLGYFYGSITKSLGFIPHRHEGKVLGLAAYVKEPESYPLIRDMIECDMEKKSFISLMQNGVYKPRYVNKELDDYVKDFDREDIASSAQKRLEEVVCDLVSSIDDENINIALAGGVFANVKLNQKILELEQVKDVYIFPNMGDGGLSIGAAYLAHYEKTKTKPETYKNTLKGNDIEEAEILQALNGGTLNYKKEENINLAIAKLLADSQIVVRVNGNMEFGPRALGNRSILYKTSDPKVNKWLNEMLNRSEFMPFAPATLKEYAEEYYEGLYGGVTAAKFMTMTFNCTEKMCEESPAAVHVDNTARPQLIDEESYPDFYSTLKHYYDLTGLPSLINTSFNMHEEPIVCTADDAIRAFCASGLPWMALGDYLVEGVSNLDVL